MMREEHSEQEDEIQAFWTWLHSPRTRRPGIRGSSHITQCSFIPSAAVKEYLGAPGRVEDLLVSIFRNEPTATVDAEVVRQHYLRPLAILLLIGKGPMIKHFVQYQSLRDHHLPYRSRTDDFPFSKDPDFFDRFSKEQWQFCATDLEYNMNLHLHEEEILPITHKKEAGHGGNAFIYKIEVHEDYNKLVPQHWKIPERPAHLQHTFVLKTYRGNDAKDQYTAEREAFMRLKYDKQPIPFVIAYYGSFIDKDTYNIILEYADKGNLEDFMKSTREPATNEETIDYWERFCSITHGLAHIHGVPVSADTGNVRFTGWHQDIKPANILVFSGMSDYDVCFKIADLSLCHFKENVSLQSEDSDIDAFGTRAYGAPETFRNDDTPYFPVKVRPDVDIWSLGCVFSEFAVWLSFGWSRVRQYRKHRRAEVKESIDLDGEELFHDGRHLLQSVQSMHAVCKRAGPTDHVTAEILRLVNEEMLLSEDEPRYSAKQVFHKSKRIIKSARGKTQASAPVVPPEMDDGPEYLSDPDERPQTPPSVPPGYLSGSSPSARRSAPLCVDASSSGRPMSVSSTRSLSPGVRSAIASRLNHSISWKSDSQTRFNDNALGSPQSPSISLHDLPDPPSPASSYQSSIGNFNTLSIRTQNLDYPQRNRRPHRETVDNASNGKARHVPRDASLRRSQTEKKSSNNPHRKSVSSFSSQSDPPSPVQNSKSRLPTPPSSSKKHHRSKSTPEEAGEKIPADPHLQTGSQMEPERPHLSLQEGLRWKQRKKDGYVTQLKGHENLTYLNQRDHIFVIDNTESMRPHRTNVLRVVSLLAYLLKNSDPNGLDVCFTQSTEKKNSGSATKISEVVKKAVFNGVSDMRTCLSRIFQEHETKFGTTIPPSWYKRSAREAQKPLSFYVLTDGKWQPNEVGPIITALVDSMRASKLHKDHVGIQFIRFGQDPRGIERLNQLDHGLGLKEIDMDIVDTTSWDGNVWKQLLGAINSWYDDDPD